MSHLVYFCSHDRTTGVLIYVDFIEEKFHLVDSGEVCDGLLDFLWHAGNENKANYDV